MLVATSSDPALIGAVDAFRTTPFPVGRVSSEVPTRLYHTSVTPYGYVIDPEGKIRAKGVAADDSSIRKLLRQIDRTPVNVVSAVS